MRSFHELASARTASARWRRRESAGASLRAPPRPPRTRARGRSPGDAPERAVRVPEGTGVQSDEPASSLGSCARAGSVGRARLAPSGRDARLVGRLQCRRPTRLSRRDPLRSFPGRMARAVQVLLIAAGRGSRRWAPRPPGRASPRRRRRGSAARPACPRAHAARACKTQRNFESAARAHQPREHRDATQSSSASALLFSRPAPGRRASAETSAISPSSASPSSRAASASAPRVSAGAGSGLLLLLAQVALGLARLGLQEHLRQDGVELGHRRGGRGGSTAARRAPSCAIRARRRADRSDPSAVSPASARAPPAPSPRASGTSRAAAGASPAGPGGSCRRPPAGSRFSRAPAEKPASARLIDPAGASESSRVTGAPSLASSSSLFLTFLSAGASRAGLAVGSVFPGSPAPSAG